MVYWFANQNGRKRGEFGCCDGNNGTPQTISEQARYVRPEKMADSDHRNGAAAGFRADAGLDTPGVAPTPGASR
jgi:hypothetical protein